MTDKKMAELLEMVSSTLSRTALTKNAGFGKEGSDQIAHEGLRLTLESLAEGSVDELGRLPHAFRDAAYARVADAIERLYEGDSIATATGHLREGRLPSAVNALVSALREGYVSADQVPASATLYGSQFFARNPDVVAEALCGSSLTYTAGVGSAGSVLASKTGSYPNPTRKDRATAEAEPGTIGVYSAQGKDILIVSAHEAGDAGTVAIWEGNGLSMEGIADALHIRDNDGLVIGDSAPIEVHPRNAAVDRVGGLYVKALSRSQLKGASVGYKLSR